MPLLTCGDYIFFYTRLIFTGSSDKTKYLKMDRKTRISRDDKKNSHRG